ncbi:MAG TPA: thiamine-phosphate kinase [Stellaceae bacterium]|nr:thiamine-phosphate kinase [Stellaceae bacterium]
MDPAANGLGEFERIARFLAPLTAGAPGALGLTDDAALLGEGRVVTVDAIVEGVHFLPADPPDLVARKLLRVNLSDIAAMGAEPESYLLAMALPSRCGDRWIEGFATGLAADQPLFGVTLIGGDSTATPGPITLSVTMIGRARPPGPVLRSGATPGDIIYVSGTIGDGALGLLAATGRLPGLATAAASFLEDRYRLPQPRTALGPALAGVATAMIDVSDGLVADLSHICETSGVGGVIRADALPLSDAASEVLAEAPSLIETVLTGGDDYELLFTAPAAAGDAVARLAAAGRTPVAAIGRIVRGGGVVVVDRDGCPLPLARMGYRHG